MKQIKNDGQSITFNGKEYKIKYSLNNSEYTQFIATVLNNINIEKEKENGLPYFIIKPLIIEKVICQYYIKFDNDDDIDKEIEFLTNTFDKDKKIVDVIKEIIYYPQFEDILVAIDEGLDFTMKLEFYQNSIDNKINQILSKILDFSDNFPKWAEFVNKLMESGDGQKIISLVTPFIMKQFSKVKEDTKDTVNTVNKSSKILK